MADSMNTEVEASSASQCVLYIIRGAPGSGKTTMAEWLATNEKWDSGIWQSIEADSYFIVNGIYRFDPTMLPQAHQWCQKNVELLMCGKMPNIVVTNTATCYWEMLPYVKMATKYGYLIGFLEPNTPWARTPEVLVDKNTHRVPLFAINRMLENLAKCPTLANPVEMVKVILATGGTRPESSSC